MSCNYDDALTLKTWYQNLCLGHPIKIWLNDEEVRSDRGPGNYQLSMDNENLRLIEVRATLEQFNKLATSKKKLEYLAKLVGFTPSDLWGMASRFSNVQRFMEDLYANWLQSGRPDSHIFRD